MEASIFTSDDRWVRGRELSSTIEKLAGCPGAQHEKTPVGALMLNPDQRFIYQSMHAKNWVFLIETLALLPEPVVLREYPLLVKSEGIAPSLLGVIPTEKDSVMEIEERYDLGSRDGFGDEGEEDDQREDEFGEEADDSQGVDEY
ncbi:MAG: hypothetical protein HWD58_16425 [Bacteroidota bacterium]|nr:MAG: hypothetical protein HWD58_16425 [Bacteroidota bacterium]